MISTDRTLLFLFFFFNDTATTEIYTLSLHDALPISGRDNHTRYGPKRSAKETDRRAEQRSQDQDRKSTRLNSSHVEISYAVFCLKKKKKKEEHLHPQRKRLTTLQQADTQQAHRTRAA